MYNLKDPNLILDKIMDHWLKMMDKYAPIILVTSIYGKNRLNLSKECWKLIKIRNKAKEVSKRLGAEEDWNQYKRLNNFFVDKIERIEYNLGAPTQGPLLMLKAVMGKWQKCGQIKGFSFKQIDVKVVQKLLKR